MGVSKAVRSSYYCADTDSPSPHTMISYRTTALLLPALSAACLMAGCAASMPAGDKPQCTEMCDSHTDGYDWAQRGDYANPAVCEGHPPAFIAGCRDGIEDRNQLRRGSRGF